MSARDLHDVANLRVPPHSLEAEQSVLGGFLIDPASFDKVSDLLDESDLYRLEHRLIFAAVASLVKRSLPTDVVTVFERLQATGEDRKIEGAMAYLNALAISVPSAANARAYAKIVRERSVLRALIAACDEGATAGFNPQGRTAADVLDEVATKIAQLDRKQVRQQPRHIGSVLVERIDHLRAVDEGREQLAWSTGIPRLDELLNGGMRPGRVYVLAARPKVGKSSLAAHLGLRWARGDLTTLMLSQEMPAGEVCDRAISNEGAIDYGALQNAKLEENDGWGRLTDAVDRLGRIPFWIDDQPSLRLSDIRAKARAVSGLKVLIVDYLQLSSGSGKGDNRNAEIEEISRGLKALAKELGIVVLLLSQLNRKVEERQDRRPILSDLRDSGAIEQDADVIVFLWPGREVGASKLVGCEVAAQRNGPTGELVLAFHGSTQHWGESTEPLKGPVYKKQGRDFE